MLYALLVMLSLGLAQSVKAAGLSGTYTIDPTKSASSSNYTSFNDADSDLIYGSRASGGTANGPGVTGATVFNVANGTYVESLDVPYIAGTSASNTVTFQSKALDSSKVILSWSAGGSYSSPNFVLHLDNTSFIIFNEITMQMDMGSVSYSYYDQVVICDNVSDSNTITHCQLIGPWAPGVTFQGSLIYSGYNYTTYTYSQDQYNTFSNNYMKGGYFGVYWFGSFTSGGAEAGNVFDHNTIDSVYYYGMYTYTQDGITITNNKINMVYGNYGIYSFYNGYSYYGASNTNLIANNFIPVGDANSPSAGAGMMIYYCDQTDVVYNSVNIYGNMGNSYGAYFYYYTTTSALNVYNNSFVNMSSSATAALYGYYLTDENYNNLYTAGSNLVTYNGSGYSSLSAWTSSGVGFGANDVSGNPIYNSNEDLHANSPTLNNAANPLSYVLDDIDGQTRSTTTPDIGADEFTPPALSPDVNQITAPTSGFCVGTQDVYVNLFNKGVNTITTANIAWSVNGVAQTSFSWTGSVASAKSVSIKIGSYNFSSATTKYTIVSYPDSANGTYFAKATGAYDSIVIGAGLKGAFTIDPSGAGNYTSFRAAVSDLNAHGVCGAITYTVSDGTYNESIQINYLPGASATNTVTFQSKSKDSSKVLIDTAWGASYPTRGYAVSMNGADYVTFNQISIYNIPSSMYAYADVVQLTQGANHNTFSNAVIGTSTTAYSTYGSAVYAPSGSYNTFWNTQINGGEYVVYLGSGSTQMGNVFYGNTIDSGAYMGAYITYQDSMNFSANKIVQGAGYYCLYLYQIQGNGTGYDSSLISNNFINLQSTYGYAVMADYCTMMNFYNNSVNTASSYSYYYGAYFYNYVSSVVNVVNNIFNSYNGGAVFYAYSSAISYCDYNDYYSTGGTLGYWSGTAFSSVSGLSSLNSMDANSVSGDPLFNNVATNDLHLTSLSIPVIHVGIARGMVPLDIDGQKRAPRPNMGADETHMYLIDASATAIDSPSAGFCSGTKDVYVKFSNAGSSTLTSANMNWSVDGTAMTTYSWTGSLASLKSVDIKVGSVTFVAGKSKVIKAWTSSPNSAVDSNPLNDTTSIRKGGGMSGTFTIGGVTPDFATFRDATNSLKVLGVCGATTFNVADGQYNESVDLPAINGSSATSTITFKSKSNDSSKVILDTSWSASPGYAVCLNGASYITFHAMTIMNTPSVSYSTADGVLLTGKANYNTFSNNVIVTNTSTSTYNYGYTVADDYNTLDQYNTFSNNQINGGYYAVYLGAPYSTTSGEMGNVLYHNMIDSANEMGVYSQYQDSVTINGNNINMTSGYYGMYLYQTIGNGSGNDSSYIMNNFISLASSYGYDLLGYYNNMVNIYNNSFYSTSSYSYYYTIYLYDYTSHILNFDNNIVQNDNGGTLFYIYLSGGTVTSDFNDWYATGTYGTWNGSSCSSLSDIQTANSMDVHSVSGDAMFNSSSTGDLHLTSASALVEHDGYPYPSVTEDIDQQKRSPKPNIGADETRSYDYDASAASIDSPATGFCSGTKDVYVRLLNAGNKTLTSVNIDWTVNGTSMSTVSWTGSLASYASTLVKLGSVTFVSGSSKSVVVWTSKPDGVLDSNSANDTARANKGGGLTGKYTIGGAAPSYNTFNAAVSALNGQGVCGAVIFNVRDGYYNESIIIKAFTGSSATNTVTFQSQSLDSSKVILDTTTAGGYSSPGHTVELNGATYVTFNKMTISNVGGSYTYDHVIDLKGGASHNTFMNNVLMGNTGSGYYDYTVYDDPSSYGEQWNTFNNNQINGGYYVVYLSGTYSNPEFGNVLSHNMIDSGGYMGVYANYQDSLIITANNIVMPAGYYGIYLNYLYANGGGTDSSLVSNNFITTQNSYGYTMYAYYTAMLNVYNNSFYSSNTTSYYYEVYLYNYMSGFINNFADNVVSNDNGGALVYAYNVSYSDFNDWYGTGSSYGYWQGTGCSSLSDIQSANSMDANSVSGDPYYNSSSTGDLHATSSSTIISNDGVPLSVVPTDIDGDPRSKTKPDMGADEFGSSAIDLGVTAILSPAKGNCGNKATLVEVKVHNFGTAAQSKYKVHVIVTTTSGTDTATRYKTNTINAGSDDTAWVWFNPMLNTSAGGTISVKAYTIISGDADATNDSTSTSIALTTPPTAKFSLASAAICSGDSFNVTDKSGATTFKYYLVDYTGKTPVVVDSSTSQNPVFNKKYTNNGYYRIVQGVWNGGTCYDSTSMGATILAAPVASFVDTTGCPGDVSNFHSTSTAGSGTITSTTWDFGNTKTANTADAKTTYAMGSYTVLLTVKNSNGCSSTASVGVNIDTATASFTYTIDLTGGTGVHFHAVDSNMTSYSWDFGDGSATSTAFNPTHIYSSKASYKVKLTATNGGCSGTDSAVIVYTGIAGELEANNYHLNIYPNPFNEYTNISYSLEKASQVKVEVMDVLGRTVATLVNHNQTEGAYNVKFDATEYNGTNAGIYIVRMTIGDRIVTKQITLVK